MTVGPFQLLIILLIVLVLFGTKRLRNIGSDLGGAIKGFRSAMRDGEKESAESQAHLEEKEGVKVELRQGFDAERLTLENIEASQAPTLLCLDDFSDKCARSDEIARIATNGRHKNITLLIILHSLFYKYPASRIIMGNTAYFFLFPSVRMLSQVGILGSQLGMRERLVQAYKQATEVREEPYRYLLIDMTPCTPDLLRLRSDIHRQVQFCYAKTI